MIDNERRTVSYLPPLQARLVRNMAVKTGQSVSAIITGAVKDKFDKMSPQERERLLGVKK